MDYINYHKYAWEVVVEKKSKNYFVKIVKAYKTKEQYTRTLQKFPTLTQAYDFAEITADKENIKFIGVGNKTK